MSRSLGPVTIAATATGGRPRADAPSDPAAPDRGVRRRRGRSARRIATALVTASFALGAVGVVPVAAAPQLLVKTIDLDSPTVVVDQGHVEWLEPTSVTWFDVDITVSAKWHAAVVTNIGWEGDHLRQGAGLDVSRSVPASPGVLDVTYDSHGTVRPFNGIFGAWDIGYPHSEKGVSCPAALTGASFDCAVDSSVFTLVPGAGPGTPYVKLHVSSVFHVTPGEGAVLRSLSIGGTTTASGSVNLSKGVSVDHLQMPCTAEPGDSVAYHLNNFSWSPAVDLHDYYAFEIGVMDPTGFIELPSVKGGLADWTKPVSITLTNPGFSVPMGPLLANNVSPTIAPLGGFSGNEGAPIQFSANVGSICDVASFVWDFSNGTRSYGSAPARAFGDDGLYDGQLTVTDVTGRSATRSFSVAVVDMAPNVNAGPDTTADWGRPVAFNGQAVDPGWLDQPTLQYVWTFGDGTPSAAGGASVVHSYSLPGAYTASLSVCDKENACAMDSRQITVTQRTTTVGYTGPLTSAPSKNVTLTATLVDEYGQPVAARNVTFQLGSQQAVGTTDAAGHAAVTLKVGTKGDNALNVTFAGDPRYLAADDLGRTFVIGK